MYPIVLRERDFSLRFIVYKIPPPTLSTESI